jgi:parallel beta-helix repeat protein
MRTSLFLSALVLSAGCSSTITCKKVDRTTCVEIEDGDVQALQDAANSLDDDSAIVLAEGTFELNNAVTFRGASAVTFIGQGAGVTVLDFGSNANQTNGVDVIADDFHIEGLTILDAPKDGLRIEDSDGIVIRGVEATWTNASDSENGAYGLYPVKVQHVLMEDNIASNASDAGIYVGQCQHAIVRNNIARGNVAGLEIENTQFADVYGNEVIDNTGGLVVFDLPGNPIVGRDIHIHDNIIHDNNRANFAPGGVVRAIPAGTGTFAMASRRVVIANNSYAENDSFDIAVISGLAIEGDEALWLIADEDMVGNVDGLDLDAATGGVTNFRSTDVSVYGNTHEGSGTEPDISSLSERELGFLMGVLYGDEVVDSVLYDAIGESAHDPTEASGNSNDNRICVGADPGVTFASLNLEALAEMTVPDIALVYRPDAPFAPFDCEGIDPIAPDVEAE